MGSKMCYPVSVQALLIRQIQAELGMAPCYATAARDCCVNINCCWRSDCYCDDAECSFDGAVPVRAAPDDFHHKGSR